MIFPKDKITKSDMADYYARIADYMLPHIAGHPVTMRRFPEGIGEDGFYNKHAPEHFPGFIERLSVPMHTQTDRDMEMVALNTAKDLVYLANQDVVELHIGLSTKADYDVPDQMVFDFDPSDDDFEKVRTAAFALKDILDSHSLPAFVKTSGAHGVHVHVPLQPCSPFEEVKESARNLADMLVEQHPDITTMEQRKNKRGKKMFIDILRNDHGMTAVAPYSLRAMTGAPVSTPVTWDELADTSLKPTSYTLKNIFRRLGQTDCPWTDFKDHRATLPPACW